MSKSTASLITHDNKVRARRRQPELVRANVLRSALDTFATHGFEGSSVRNIAENAGVSIQLLLYHFKSKDNLWRETIDLVSSKSADMVDISSADAASAAQVLEIIIENLVRLFAEFPALHRLMTMEGHELSDRLIWLCDKYGRRNFKAISDVIAAGQKEGVVIEGDPGQLRMLVVALAAVPFSVSAEYKLLTNRDPFENSETQNLIAIIKRMLFKPAQG